LTVNGSVRLGSGDHPLVFPIYAMARQIDFADGRRLTDVGLHQSFPVLAGFTLSNALDYNRTSTATGLVSTRFTGTFDLSTFAGSRTQYRASLDYTVTPHPRLDAAQIEVNHSFDDRTLVRAALGRNFSAQQYSAGLSAQRRFDRFTVSIDGNYATHPRQYSATLRLAFGFGRNPLNGRWFLAPPGLSAGGALAIRAYRDVDGDGRFDAGDVVLPEVEFGTATVRAKTGKDGIAFLGRLGDGPRTSVQVDRDSLPDITMAPVTKGIAIAPRAGRVHIRDFAIVGLGEVDGTATFVGTGTDKPVGGVALQLFDREGKLVAHTRSSSDGKFYFEQLLPGQYALRLDPRQMRDLSIATIDDAVAISIAPAGGTRTAAIRIRSTKAPAPNR
jgi:hypothetical protein